MNRDFTARPSPRRRHAALVCAVWAVAVLAAGCGEGSTSLAGPGEEKCQISVTSFSRSFGPSGGSGTVSLQAARECTWSAESPTDWISFPAAPAGQGGGSFSFAVSANPMPRAREGTIEVSGHKLAVSQEAAPCEFALGSTGVQIDAGGGSGVVGVTAAAGCSWTARSVVSWVSIDRGAAGDGPGEVAFSVAPNHGGARSGELLVAGRTFRIDQQPAAGMPPAPPPAPPPTPTCQYSVTPRSLAFPAAGGQQALNLSTGAGCPWTAASTDAWLAVGASAGEGPATLTVTAAPNAAGSPRNASLLVAGLSVQVTQEATAQQCEYVLSPAGSNLPAAGGTVSLSLATGSGCSWQASSDVPWAAVGPPSSGTGPASIPVAVEPNGGTAARTATIRAGGVTATINQQPAAPACEFSVAPASGSFPAAGGELAVQVSTGGGCSWTATSGASWLTVSPTSGTGPATVNVTAAANPDSAPRNGTATVAGTLVALTQDAAPVPPPTDEIQVDGRVRDLRGRCPEVAFDLRGYSVATTASTAYGPDPPGTACGDLRDGLNVTVTGLLGQDRRITATAIILERN